MPGRPSDAGSVGSGAIVPFSPDQASLSTRPLRHGVAPPVARVFISWSRGSLLNVACIRPPEAAADGRGGGAVVEVDFGFVAADEELDAARRRRIAYGSVTPFVVLRDQKRSFLESPSVPSVPDQTEWWQHVLDYSKYLKGLLSNPRPDNVPVIEDRRVFLEVGEEPTHLLAAWELMEICFVDKQLESWLPERLVDWLADYDVLLRTTGNTVYSTLADFQEKLHNMTPIIEDQTSYWQCLSGTLAVGWLDVVVRMLRLHGSYKLDQLDIREIENGLVETVAQLVSSMPRMRPDLPSGKLGQCHRSRPEFIKSWELWRAQVKKLEESAFWIQCGHQKTRQGLKNMLQIMQGNVKRVMEATHHWLELLIAHFLYITPLALGWEEIHHLAQRCMELKPSSNNSVLIGILIGVLSLNEELVVAECSKKLGPWMATHAVELLTAYSDYGDNGLCKQQNEFSNLRIDQFHRLMYAQLLCSHPLTRQIAPIYFATCLDPGVQLMEIFLFRQPIQDFHVTLQTVDICQRYELESICSDIMKITGIYHWKHGRKGMAIYWLQQANDKVLIDRITEQLFEHIGRSISNTNFEQLEGLLELLGADNGDASGLVFLRRYIDFKRSLQLVLDGKDSDRGRQTVELLMKLMRNPYTPVRFWLPLLHDLVKLLNWKAGTLLNVADTNYLLTKLQLLSMTKLHPGFPDGNLHTRSLSSIRLALAKNLGRAFLAEN